MAATDAQGGASDLVKLYEDAAYAQRTVFSHLAGWLLADLNDDGVVDSTDEDLYNAADPCDPASRADLNGNGWVGGDGGDLALLGGAMGSTIGNDTLCMAPRMESFVEPTAQLTGQFTGLCPLGHQGLYHDREFQTIDNRRRTLNPWMGRFMQRDPAGYGDGMGLYEYLCSCPVSTRDPLGENYGDPHEPSSPRPPSLEEQALAALKNFHEVRRRLAPIMTRVAGLDALIPRLEAVLRKYEHRRLSRDSKFKMKKVYWWWEGWFEWGPVMSNAVFHESIHALDFDNRWHAPNDLADAEELAWTAEAVDWAMGRIGIVEGAIRYAKANPTEPVDIRAAWDRQWAIVKNSWASNTVQYVDKTSKCITPEMLWDVNGKLGFRVSCSAILAAFEEEWPDLKPCWRLRCPEGLPDPFK